MSAHVIGFSFPYSRRYSLQNSVRVNGCLAYFNLLLNCIYVQQVLVFRIRSQSNNADTSNWASGTLIFYLISLVITILATLIIIFRITYVCRGNGAGLGGYSYTIEILVESGVLYAAPLMLSVILSAIAGGHITYHNPSIIKAEIYLTGIVTPMAVCFVRLSSIHKHDQPFIIFSFGFRELHRPSLHSALRRGVREMILSGPGHYPPWTFAGQAMVASAPKMLGVIQLYRFFSITEHGE